MYCIYVSDVAVKPGLYFWHFSPDYDMTNIFNDALVYAFETLMAFVNKCICLVFGILKRIRLLLRDIHLTNVVAFPAYAN